MKVTSSRVIRGFGCFVFFDEEPHGLRTNTIICDDVLNAWRVDAVEEMPNGSNGYTLVAVDGTLECPPVGHRLEIAVRPLGRPQKANNEVKWTVLSVRLTHEERGQLDDAAAKAGLKLSEYVRRKLLPTK